MLKLLMSAFLIFIIGVKGDFTGVFVYFMIFMFQVFRLQGYMVLLDTGKVRVYTGRQIGSSRIIIRSMKVQGRMHLFHDSKAKGSGRVLKPGM